MKPVQMSYHILRNVSKNIFPARHRSTLLPGDVHTTEERRTIRLCIAATCVVPTPKCPQDLNHPYTDVCTVNIFCTLWINRVWLPIRLVSSENKNMYFFVVSVWLLLGLTARLRRSCPAFKRSFSTLRLNLVRTRGIPPTCLDGVHLYHHSQTSQSRVFN